MNNLQKTAQLCQKNHQPLWQFNFSSLEQLKGIIAAVKKQKIPVILGVSEGEAEYIGLEMAAALRDFYRRKYNLELFLNLDHGQSLDIIEQAVKAGYDMVQADGSALPWPENIAFTKKAAGLAKAGQIMIEGELGYLRGSSQIHKDMAVIKEEDLTKPEQAKEFVEKTKVDFLAVVIGNVHGIYSQMPHLYLDRLAEIKKAVLPEILLTLHGGSGIVQQELQGAVKQGIVKININTELRQAWRQSLEESLAQDKEQLRPYKILEPVEQAVQQAVAEKIASLNENYPPKI